MNDYVHLAFTGNRYALCGATVNSLNAATAIAAQATCPDCVKGNKDDEHVNATLHHDTPATIKPEYENRAD